MPVPHTVFALKGVTLNNWPLMHRCLKDVVLSAEIIGIRELWTVNDGGYVKAAPFDAPFNLTSSGRTINDSQRLETLSVASQQNIWHEVEINPKTDSHQILSNWSAETTVVMAWLLCLYEMNPESVEVQTTEFTTQWQKALKLAKDCGFSGDTIPWATKADLVTPSVAIHIPASMDFRA